LYRRDERTALIAIVDRQFSPFNRLACTFEVAAYQQGNRNRPPCAGEPQVEEYDAASNI